ncbi:hypothetical protein [Streptomyces sp. NPDC047706]|uniref:hypothetical protein n=1 Tax=Streptomyces sp. NPDC047706 TaxID=3365486 RepID=UPI00370FCD2E
MPSQSAASLRSRYVEQAASDLEKNRRLQGELAEKIRVLKQEEALLVDILTLAERYVDSSDASPHRERADTEVAAPRQEAVSEDMPAGVGESPDHAPTKRRSGGGTSGSSAVSRNRRPPLGDILAELLSSHDEPRHAKELRDELLEKHPGRTPTPQVVRNTLESLVAKGKIRRYKQKRSVLYTLAESHVRKAVTASVGDT